MEMAKRFGPPNLDSDYADLEKEEKPAFLRLSGSAS
jgi:hypothetical protein